MELCGELVYPYELRSSSVCVCVCLCVWVKPFSAKPQGPSRGPGLQNLGPPAHAAHPCVVTRIFKETEESQYCFSGVFVVCLCWFAGFPCKLSGATMLRRLWFVYEGGAGAPPSASPLEMWLFSCRSVICIQRTHCVMEKRSPERV